MSEPEPGVASLAERLRARREELGLSQAQAARELDVARTAYRLWEMEAAKPQPDRWKLISRWLGVSVTTMLLADEFDDEPALPGSQAAAFRRVGADGEQPARNASDFFTRIGEIVQEGAERGFVSAEDAEDVLGMVRRIRDEYLEEPSVPWEPATLSRALRPGPDAPATARQAIRFVCDGISSEALEAALLLTSELVTNSVKYGPTGPDDLVGLTIEVTRSRLRVEVRDAAQGTPTLGPPRGTGGFGLPLVDELACRWNTARADEGNTTWFELDLAEPGAGPSRP